jgi:hypothetical protein
MHDTTMNSIVEYAVSPPPLKRQRTSAETKSASAVDNILNIHPYKLLCDATSLDDQALDSLESRLKGLLRSIDTIKHVRRTRTIQKDEDRKDQMSLTTIDVHKTATQDETVLHSTPIHTQVLRQLTISDYLTAEDLGRLLLLTSKSFISDLGEDFVYFQLCRKRWRNSASIPTLAKVRGYPWLYQTLSQGPEKPKKRVWPTLPVPTLTPESMTLLVNIRDGHREVLSEVVRGESLKELLHCGQVYIPLEHPILIEDYPIDHVPQRNQPSAEFEGWNATMHAVRLDDHTCCCVHRSTDVLEGSDKNKNWNLHFLPELAGLELTDEGKEFEARIREYDRSVHNLPSEGIYFTASAVSSTFSCPTDRSKVRIAFTRLKVEILEMYDLLGGDVYDSDVVSKTHGVTALHLLDKLRGMESPNQRAVFG